MAATIELEGVNATVKGGKWECAVLSLEKSLSLLWDTMQDPFAYYPDRDYAMADLAVKHMGAKLISYGKPKAGGAGVVY